MPPTRDAPPPRLRRSEQPLVTRYDCALLDLDGVVYVGGDPIDGAPEVLADARAQGMALAFVTNNASRPPVEVAQRLSAMGVPANASQVVTSAQAAASEVANRVPVGSRVLVVGGTGLVAALEERGLVPVASSDDGPAAVIQGFGPDVSWRHLADAAVAIRAGAVWIASNTDQTVPTPRGLAPGNGSLVNAVAAAVGFRPAAVAGKPFRPLFHETVERVASTRPLVVGDRLDTDIEGARSFGADSLLVMTGVTDLQVLCAAGPEQRPTYVAWTLGGLLTSHPAPSANDGSWSLGGWSVCVRDANVRVEASGPDRDDGLRAVVSACWAARDADADRELDLGDVAAALSQLR